MSRIYTDLAAPSIDHRGIVIRDLFSTDLDRLQDLIEIPQVDGTRLTSDPCVDGRTL